MALVMMIRIEPVAAREGVGRHAKSADAARMAEESFAIRNEPNIVFESLNA